MSAVLHWSVSPRMWGLLMCMVFVVCCQVTLQAQKTGEQPPPDDSVIVFSPALPLLTDEAAAKAAIVHTGGFNLLFSQSGWGAGGFYSYRLGDNSSIVVSVDISGRRNTDEFENAWLGPIPVVAEKVNRLFMIPATIGFQYRLFADDLQDSFRPFVMAGFTPTLILQSPYIRDGIYYEFFQSFGYARTYLRWGGVFGVGSMFGNIAEGSVVGFTARYYTIPFGGDGLESMRDFPITNFGGVFLTLSAGWTW
ncbi:MAG: hypothetical protein H3C37_05870 [Candidatus Kapabacteria bacterium]|nr:MAG: hypothetical protein F9K28_07745 [Bacteroidota bacterium]MBW7853767.1 hypothetical protein [Candidatus Kapabacteria bacterium]MCL4276853.1 hypothetical protein [Ignavibacteria bacterium]